jgi:hypothetical protein
VLAVANFPVDIKSQVVRAKKPVSARRRNQHAKTRALPGGAATGFRHSFVIRHSRFVIIQCREHEHEQEQE